MGDESVTGKRRNLITVHGKDYSFSVVTRPKYTTFFDESVRLATSAPEMGELIDHVLTKEKEGVQQRFLRSMLYNPVFLNTGCRYALNEIVIIDYPPVEGDRLCDHCDSRFTDEKRNPHNGLRYISYDLAQAIHNGPNADAKKNQLLEIVFGPTGRSALEKLAKHFSHSYRIHIDNKPTKEPIVFPLVLHGAHRYYLDVDLSWTCSHALAFLARDRLRS